MRFLDTMDQQTIERVKRGLEDPRVGPETIALMLTKACNFKCLYCLGGKSIIQDFSEELTTKELFDLFRDARDLQIKDINLGGLFGEPFCRKDIVKIMQEIKRLGLKGTMTTNGGFLNAEMAKIMTDCKWDVLRISLDSPDAAIQHALRPAVNKKPYLENIIEFLNTLQVINSKITVILNVVISKLNFRSLPELAQFANKNKNIEYVNLLRLLDMNLVNYDDLQLNDEEVKEFKSILFRLKDENKLIYSNNWIELENVNHGITQNKCGDKFKISNPENLDKCFVNYYILSINSNGDVMKCPQYALGAEGLNIKKSSLKKIWQNEHLQFRQSLAENAACFKECCTILREENKFVINALQ